MTWWVSAIARDKDQKLIYMNSVSIEEPSQDSFPTAVGEFSHAIHGKFGFSNDLDINYQIGQKQPFVNPEDPFEPE